MYKFSICPTLGLLSLSQKISRLILSRAMSPSACACNWPLPRRSHAKWPCADAGSVGCMGHSKLKDGGVLALVIPFAFVRGKSWKGAREAGAIRHWAC